MSRQVQYGLKHVEYNGRKTAIVLQNENGPCPLLAVINVLLLRGTIQIHEDRAVCSSEDLLSHIGSQLLESSERARKEAPNGDVPNQEADLMAVIQLLPRIEQGLDVNVKFCNITDFEYTAESSVFDLLGVRLVHGWLPDPQDPLVASLIQKYSYNQLVEKLVGLNTPVPPVPKYLPRSPASPKPRLGSPSTTSPPTLTRAPPSPITQPLSLDTNLDDATREGIIAERFLHESPSQLTYHGLAELHSNIREQELACFFRNNHFSTILKHKGELFVLVTDQGFQSEPVVWERLQEIDGDTSFTDGDFHNYTAPTLPPELAPGAEYAVPPALLAAQTGRDLDADFALALRLSQEDTSQLSTHHQEQTQNQHQQQQQQQHQHPDYHHDPSVQKHGRHSKDKKHKDCIVQ